MFAFHMTLETKQHRIISQKWNKNESDNKAFLRSIVWQCNKKLVSYSATNFQWNYFSFSRNVLSECPTRLKVFTCLVFAGLVFAGLALSVICLLRLIFPPVALIVLSSSV